MSPFDAGTSEPVANSAGRNAEGRIVGRLGLAFILAVLALMDVLFAACNPSMHKLLTIGWASGSSRRRASSS